MNFDMKVFPSSHLFIRAAFIGIVIPILSSIVPILQILKLNLIQALDYQRSKIQAVYVNVLLKGKRNVTFLLFLGIVAVAAGLSIYYFLPAGLLTMNFKVILNIFLSIMLCIIVSFALIALNFQSNFESIISYIFMRNQKESLKLLVQMNLRAHRSRNRLTSLIYSLSIALVIFLIISQKVQLESIKITIF